MGKCYICPVSDECSLYYKWLKEGEEAVQAINSANFQAGLATYTYDTEIIPDWFGQCPLEKFVR